MDTGINLIMTSTGATEQLATSLCNWLHNEYTNKLTTIEKLFELFNLQILNLLNARKVTCKTIPGLYHNGLEITVYDSDKFHYYCTVYRFQIPEHQGETTCYISIKPI